MPQSTWSSWWCWLCPSALLLSCGCTTFWAPWGAPARQPPAAVAAVPDQALATARNKPTVTGSQLNLKPDETAAERALELTHKLSAAEEEKKTLTMRVQQLEVSLDEKDKALAQVSKEVQAASEEMVRAREELQRWKQQVAMLRDKLGGAEKDNLATLQSIVSYLEHMSDQKQPEDKRPDKEQEPAETQAPPK
jgi:chromosome segregation ATPase